MNSEQNLPEASAPVAPPPVSSENGQSAGPGQGTSRSSRRRRRRRKSKPGETSASPEGQIVIQSGEDSDFAPQQPKPQQAGGQQGQQQGQNSPSAKRWKKKQRRRERQRTGGEYNPGNQAEPGNSMNGGGGFARRKQKAKGPRSFVGPMDHSYREANGNYAEAPPSTMEMNGNVRGGGHGKQRRNYDFEGGNVDRLPPELRAPITNTVIREDAPTHIYFFVDDLFLTAKITEASRKLGVKVAFVKNDPEHLALLFSGEANSKPSLIVFDLNNAACKPLTLIPKIRTKLKRTVSILGFLSVLQGDLKAKATEVGCDTVMPKAAFSQNLPNLLRRYGAEEDDEPNFNQ